MIQTANDDRRTMLDRPSSVVLSSACCSGKTAGLDTVADGAASPWK